MIKGNLSSRLLAPILVLALALPGMTAHAEHRHMVDGRNVSQVVYSTGSQPMGVFVETGTSNAQWTEYSDHNDLRFYFVERGRDDWSVYLYDASRDVHIQLDLHRKKISYRQGSAGAYDIYNILHAKRNHGKERPRRHEPVQPVITGQLHESVSFTLEDDSIMILERRGPTEWVEYSPGENKVYQYQEVQRSDNIVYLYDATSNLRAQIDFKQNIVLFTRDSGQDPKYFYVLHTPEQHLQIMNPQPSYPAEHDSSRHHRRETHVEYVPPAPQQPVRLTGYNARHVTFGEDGKEKGYFVNNGMNNWTQHTYDPREVNQFEELQRGENWVYLYNAAHRHYVELDFRTNKVMYGERFKIRMDAYEILRSETQ